MWYPIRDFSKNEAEKFLTEDFLKVVKRTKYLYVERKIRRDIGEGYFEPVHLCLCWCDFLGALYTGSGLEKKQGGKFTNSERSRKFIENILSQANQRYKRYAKELTKAYRNRLVHAYTPELFSIEILDDGCHLRKRNKRLHLCVENLLEDMSKAVILFSNCINQNTNNYSYGSLKRFNKARKELG